MIEFIGGPLDGKTRPMTVSASFIWVSIEGKVSQRPRSGYLFHRAVASLRDGKAARAYLYSHDTFAQCCGAFQPVAACEGVCRLCGERLRLRVFS